MSAQVLARTWRPRLFKDMVGQEHITRTLMNALRLERLHHAYLFCGTRGVGKTTIARILAKGLFCQQRKDSEPCNSCSSCQAIDEGSYADLIEVDAASRTKVEDTRDLLSDAQFAPTDGQYKIYLIDEVHMLSGHSFNALLKTLEEPPPHIIFLFATTEPQKLPMTMISRCLRFNLKMITEPAITARLWEILKAEKISFEDKAIELLAHYARGSMRDALSLVDQAIAYCERDIVYDKVAVMLGTAQLLTPAEVIDHLIHTRMDELLKATAVMEENGVDFSEFLDQLMALLQDTAVSQLRGIQSEEKNSDTQPLSAEEIQLFYQIALLTKKELPWAPSPRRAVDMGLLRMLSMQPLIAGEEWVAARPTAPPREELGEKDKAQGSKEEGNRERAEDVAVEDRTATEELELASADSPQQTDNSAQTEEALTELDLAASQPQESATDPKAVPKEEKMEKGELKQVGDEKSVTKSRQKEEKLDKAADESGGQKEAAVAMRAEQGIEGAEEAVAKAEQKAGKEKEIGAAKESAKQRNIQEKELKPSQPAPAEAGQEATDYTQPYRWAQLVESLDLAGLPASLLDDTRLVDQRKGIWLLRAPSNVCASLEGNSKGAVEQALTNKLKQSIRLDIEVGAVDDTPVMLKNERRRQMVQQLRGEPLVKNIVENYDGELDTDSVRQTDKAASN